jgi:crooked neck
MEEILGHIENCRKIFKAWMSWKPLENGWNAYIKFEERHGTPESCWEVLESFIDCHPSLKSYLWAVKYEERLRETERQRLYFEWAIAELGEKAFEDESLFLLFTKFEIR